MQTKKSRPNQSGLNKTQKHNTTIAANRKGVDKGCCLC